MALDFDITSSATAEMFAQIACAVWRPQLPRGHLEGRWLLRMQRRLDDAQVLAAAAHRRYSADISTTTQLKLLSSLWTELHGDAILLFDLIYQFCVGRTTCGHHRPYTCAGACSRLTFDQQEAVQYPAPLKCEEQGAQSAARNPQCPSDGSAHCGRLVITAL